MRPLVAAVLAACLLLATAALAPARGWRQARQSASPCQGGACASCQAGGGFGPPYTGCASCQSGAGLGCPCQQAGFACPCTSGQCGSWNCPTADVSNPNYPDAAFARPLSAQAAAAVLALPAGTCYRIQWRDGSLSELRIAGGGRSAALACPNCPGGVCPLPPGR